MKNTGLSLDVKRKMKLVGKTSGWMSRWLEFYFLQKAEITENRFQIFRNADMDRLKECINRDFQELYQLIGEIEKRVSQIGEI